MGIKTVTCVRRAVFEVLDVPNLFVCGHMFIWLFRLNSLHAAWHGSVGWLYEFNLIYLPCLKPDTEFKSVCFMLFCGKKNLISYKKKKLRKVREIKSYFLICYHLSRIVLGRTEMVHVYTISLLCILIYNARNIK